MSTIAAISTPAGTGGVAMVRVSGGKAREILARVFLPRGKASPAEAPRRAVYGRFRDDGGFFDDGVALFYPGPSSYTGEDVAELCCHGGLLVTQRLLAAVLAAGAGCAAPGEFTRRAFLNGKLTLTQAEAVGGLIEAKTDRQLEISLRQAEGALSERIRSFSDRLRHLAASVCAFIDYPDEDMTDVSVPAMRAELKDLLRALEALRGLPAKEVVKIGIPYMDEMKRRLDAAGPIAPHRTTVLIAPSWGPSAIFSKYGGKIIDKLLAGGYHVIIRPHPQSYKSEKDMIDKLMAAYPDSEDLEWNRDNDNFDVLRRADLLVSDFSGIIFDFTLVFDKPVIYADTKFDKSPYDCWWLDTPYWTFEILPQIGQQLTEDNFDTLGDMVQQCLTDPKYAQGRDTARAQTWVYPGEGAVRAADYLEQKMKELTATHEEKEP